MEARMDNYKLQGDTFIIKNYDKMPAFSSFLPGLAGIKGIPLWVYYTNRGQGINSFGIHHKNNAIMEFNPANTAYENTPVKGFRTFIKCDGVYFEPFFTYEKSIERNLYIKKNSFTIEEINNKHGLKISVKYYVLPKDSIGALVRHVHIENISGKEKEIELIDGMPKIIPFGIENGAYKEMSNLLKSWTDLKNIENNVPYYSMRASSDDSAEVQEIEGGYFYVTVRNNEVLPVIYDADVIFDHDTSLVNPVTFFDHSVEEILTMEQCFANKVPCGFTPQQFNLSAGKEYEFTTMVGFVSAPDQINEKLGDICKVEYRTNKELLADEIVDELTKDVKTMTAKPLFDQYVEQCYLDNFLRGGYPFVFNKDSNKAVVHLFSRKHGDPERDYNFFSIAGEYYSQGNGNFRDVSQNRRNDVFFNKDIGDFNVKTFFNLIQIDGYNPLEVRPSTFVVKEENKGTVKSLLRKNALGDITKLEKILNKPYTPGQIANCIARHHLTITCGEDSFLEQVLQLSDQNIEAGFGEGYWSDHWDYNLDLIENYIKVFPDKIGELLFSDHSYRFYDSAARVLPRNEKYVINKNEVRQYGSLVHDDEKSSRKDFNSKGTNWLKTKSGELATTSLMAKLISLALNKFSMLDAYGLGVEMEGGKPGWNDAMNGLPGIFGSGMAETFELKRLVQFICETVTNSPSVDMPIEIYDLLLKVFAALTNAKAEGISEFKYWDTVSSLREQYRDMTRFNLDGEVRNLDSAKILEIFKAFAEKIDTGISKALEYGNGIVPTYFTFRASEFEPVVDEAGNPVMSHYGMQKAIVKAFEIQPLPAFLEGPARMLATMSDKKAAAQLASNVKSSQLYDEKLKMYKTSVPIDDLSMENGRIRAFTAGWLERESVFLHMEYKYMLALIKSGLYETFYEEMQNALIPFLKPEMYGRSILENSSFIASSVNPNSEVHGRGFVARLSGSTTEVLSMWIEMFMGDKIFTCENGELKLNFCPKLPGWLFDENGDATFTLLSTCKVTYHNAKKKATFGESCVKAVSILLPELNKEIKGNAITGDLAQKVRNGEIKTIIVNLD
jgi:hypothetical protein